MNSASADASTASVPLPEGVRLEQVHGVDALLVDTPAATAELLLDGAHLTSWAPAGEKDLLWLSPDSAFGERQAVRGGIPLVGPWFGPGRDLAMEVKHGWLRTLRWDLASAVREGDDVVLTLRTPEDVKALAATAEFRLGAELSVALTITAGSRPLELEAALHTYLAVGDVREIAIHGLEGAEYLDNTRGLAPDVLADGPLRLTGSTDRVVDSAADVTVTDEKSGRRLVSTTPRHHQDGGLEPLGHARDGDGRGHPRYGLARVRVYRAGRREGWLRGPRARPLAHHRRHLPHRALRPAPPGGAPDPGPGRPSRGGRVLVIMCAFNQLCAARTKWSTVRMEMHTTSTTTPDSPAASSYGFAASPFAVVECARVSGVVFPSFRVCAGAFVGSYGFAAFPFRHHGQPVAQQAAGGGRSTADDAALTAG